jgi:uncharacterized protein (TIGR02757 family)
MLFIELEKLYKNLNRRKFVHPDPLEFLYLYPNQKDREIVGLVASSLAYGNVKQILKSVKKVLDLISPDPFDFIRFSNPEKWKLLFQDFKHRFAVGGDIVNLFLGIRGLLKKYSSIENAFKSHLGAGDENIIPALTGFVGEMNQLSKNDLGHLIPNPEKGSACKRLMLFLRWMIRNDEVDPGGWDISPSNLLIPLDSHMHYISKGLGFTSRKSADLKTVVRVTEVFKKILPDDPVRYDFALTRLGIRDELSRDDFINQVTGLTPR